MPKGKRTMKSQNSTKQQIAQIKREINPLIKVRSVRGNPKPININQTAFVSRTVQVVKTSSSGSAALSIQDVTGSFSSAKDLRVDFVKVWNSTPGSSLKATLNVRNVIDSTTSPSEIVGEDFGNYSSLAGIKFDIPMTLTSDITEQLSTNNIVTTVAGGQTDKIVYQIGCRISL